MIYFYNNVTRKSLAYEFHALLMAYICVLYALYSVTSSTNFGYVSGVNAGGIYVYHCYIGGYNVCV